MNYILYIWRNDTDGGYKVCRSENFPCGDESVDKIGEFNTVSELANLLHQDDPEWFAGDLQTTTAAMEMMNTLWEREESEL